MTDENAVKDDTVEEAVEEAVKLPKGVTEDMYEQAKAAIISGFKNKQDPNVIKTYLIKDLDIPLNRHMKVFSMITQAEGLAVNIKELKVAIREQVEGIEWGFDEAYGDISTIADEICNEVTHADRTRCMAVIKEYFKENEKEFPKKPAGSRGRLGAINTALINVFADNKAATPADVKAALVKVTKTEKNADDYTKQYHRLLFAVANGMNSNDVIKMIEKEA